MHNVALHLWNSEEASFFFVFLFLFSLVNVFNQVNRNANRYLYRISTWIGKYIWYCLNQIAVLVLLASILLAIYSASVWAALPPEVPFAFRFHTRQKVEASRKWIRLSSMWASLFFFNLLLAGMWGRVTAVACICMQHGNGNGKWKARAGGKGESGATSCMCVNPFMLQRIYSQFKSPGNWVMIVGHRHRRPVGYIIHRALHLDTKAKKKEIEVDKGQLPALICGKWLHQRPSPSPGPCPGHSICIAGHLIAQLAHVLRPICITWHPHSTFERRRKKRRILSCASSVEYPCFKPSIPSQKLCRITLISAPKRSAKKS